MTLLKLKILKQVAFYTCSNIKKPEILDIFNYELFIQMTPIPNIGPMEKKN